MEHVSIKIYNDNMHENKGFIFWESSNYWQSSSFFWFFAAKK